MATSAQITAKVNEAIAANESGDYATALQALTSARMLLLATPNTSHDGSSVQWDRAAIDSLIVEVRRAQTQASLTSGGMKMTKITYRRTSCE